MRYNDLLIKTIQDREIILALMMELALNEILVDLKII